MQEKLQKWLTSAAHSNGEKLPSIRVLAAKAGVSPASIYKALSALEKQKRIYPVQGKGFFWGKEGPLSEIPQSKKFLTETLEEKIIADWKAGNYIPEKDLPSIKELCEHYSSTRGTITRVLESLQKQGTLARRGKGRFFFPRIRQAKNPEIILIMRADLNGTFQSFSEQELSFLKEVYKESEQRNLFLTTLGYYEPSGIFFDKTGSIRKLSDFGKCFGAVISTMLIQKPRSLLALFAEFSFPISVWWEHPLSEIPRSLKNKRRWAFFNLAFGTFPGKAVGNFLKARGIKKAAFISPYHSSSWSKDRLTGLISSGLSIVKATDATHASPWDFLQQALKTNFAQTATLSAQKELTRIVQKLLERLPPTDAWICVNDLVGEAVLSLYHEGKITRPPYLISFDNSIKSYMLRLDSFAFNVNALAEQSLYHIVSPGVTLYNKGDFRELSGKVIIK
ncbi:MAG: GntR family transcriptional regulator [Fibrobacteraceae bacterium]|nr:GntR family transcriptional regulator [Fibrobacteraceae bacterium]